ncbi:MAG TPA: P-loop NTPase [Gemmatimonadaceae bacterium]|nr:P-loop NTPase [Gemmatimonadaceae bacterium]
MSFRTYHEVAGEDRSGLGAQVATQRAAVRERLRTVRHVVAVTSGKGGVGKSFVTAALAEAIAPRLPHAVGVLDADLGAPTVARLLAADGPLRVESDGVQPALGRGGVRVISTDLLLADGEPLAWRAPPADSFVWRGALEAGILREFLAHVTWGTLALLLVDLPPGSARLHDLADLVPTLAGALVVTQPAEASRRAVERTMHDARRAGVRLLGVVENMRGYRCPGCACTMPLFAGDAGAALSAAFDVPLLGALPFDPSSGAEPDRDAMARLAAAFMEALE